MKRRLLILVKHFAYGVAGAGWGAALGVGLWVGWVDTPLPWYGFVAVSAGVTTIVGAVWGDRLLGRIEEAPYHASEEWFGDHHPAHKQGLLR